MGDTGRQGDGGRGYPTLRGHGGMVTDGVDDGTGRAGDGGGTEAPMDTASNEPPGPATSSPTPEASGARPEPPPASWEAASDATVPDPPNEDLRSSMLPFEVEHVHASVGHELGDRFRALEIWTENRMYGLDGQWVCFEVVDRATGESDPRHGLLGARLVGGQVRTREGHVDEISHPLPRVGGLAVLERRGAHRVSFAETSPVVRIVMRVRVIGLDTGDAAPAWRRITSTLR